MENSRPSFCAQSRGFVYASFALATLSVFLLTTVGGFEVYTNQIDWINAVCEENGRIFGENFNGETERNFTAGDTDIGTLTFNIEGEEDFQGFFNNFFSPNPAEDQYFIGKITDVNNPSITLKNFQFKDPTRVFAFGGLFLFTVSNDPEEANLVLTVNDIEINFSDHLEAPGSSFLGVVLDEDEGFFDEVVFTKDIDDNGEQFLMDDITFGIKDDEEQAMSMDFLRW